MKRIGLTVVLAVLVFAPAWSKGFKDRDTLAPDEGVLVTQVTCGSRITGVQLFQSGKASGSFWGPLRSEGSLGCTAGLQFERLKAGRYYIGQFFNGTSNMAVPEDKSPQFNVEAGKLNYVGDIYAGDVAMAGLDQETLLHVIGRALSVINHEPQVRQTLDKEHAGLRARLPLAVDPALSAPGAVGPTREPVPGEMRGTMSLQASRWKRGDDGQPRICTKLVPLPKGTTLAPGDDQACSGEFVTPEAYLAAEYGPNVTIDLVKPRDGDDSALIVMYSVVSHEEGAKK